MTRPRIALYSLGLILIVVIGVGYYYYQKFPLIIEAQAKQHLQGYGVDKLRYERLRISRQQLRIDALHFSGEYGELSYQVSIASLSMTYGWRKILNGEAQSVTLGKIELSLTKTVASVPASTSAAINLAQYFPRAMLDALPVEWVDIKHWQINYQPDTGPKVSASGSLRLSDQLQLHMQSVHQGSRLTANIVTQGEEAYPNAEIQLYDTNNHLLALDITLTSADSAAWHWAVQGELNYAPTLTWLRHQNTTLEPALNLSAIESLRLDGTSQFTANLSHPAELTLPNAATALDYSSLELQARTLNAVAEMGSSTSLTKIAGDLALNVTLSAGKLSFTLGATELRGLLDTAQLALPAETLQWLGWTDTIAVHWSNPSDVLFAPTESGSWVFSLTNNLLALGDKSSELRWENLTLDAALGVTDEVYVRANIETRLNARLRKNRMPPINFTLGVDGTSSQSRIELAFKDVAESMRGSLEGEVNLNNGQGRFQTSLSSQDLAYASETLLPLLDDLKLLKKGVAITLSSGTMSLNSQLESSSFELADLKQQSELKINDFSGVYDEYPFEGIALDAQWSGIEQWQTQRPVEFTMERFNMGFDLLDTRALLSLPKTTDFDNQKITINEFSSGVFGGNVYLPKPYEWDFAARSNRVTLRAKEWRLADMVAMQEGQDIQAQGTLEGALPVTVTAGRIIIADGYLRALPPGGTIRYIANESSRSLAASSPEFGMALDLLSDFQYEVLSSQVELDEAGNLSLGLSLAGKNLELFEGRIVNFNINLEQNLDPLLQSLRLSDRLVEELESRIK
ncbi:MAG: hypothetical protein ACJAYG_001385 [Oceanicoccus sp.]|jgi:hypothetical protein